MRFSKSNNGEEEQIKEQKGHLGENQDWLSKLANLEVLPPPVRALGRMEKMRTSVVIDEDDCCDKTNSETGRAPPSSQVLHTYDALLGFLKPKSRRSNARRRRVIGIRSCWLQQQELEDALLALVLSSL